MTAADGRFARVLVDSPLPQLDRLFDYRIPDALVDDARPGVRVKVPFRSAGRVADGWIVELADRVDFAGEPSALDAVVSPVPVLQPEVWRLARRVADRSAGSASDVLRLALPPRQARVEKAWLARAVTGGDAAAPVAVPPPPLDGYAPSVADALDAGRRLALDAPPHPVEVDGVWVGAWAVALAAAAARAIAAGGTALLAVPDHRDQEQLATALRAALPPELVVELDARRPAPERYRGFLRCLDGGPLAVVGNRSVLYAPAARLGLIAVYNDGDPLLAEPLAPYAHARDVALLRNELQGGALVLAGHTRSTDAQRLVGLGFLDDVSPAPRRSPRVVLASRDVAGDRLAAQARIPSLAWREARTGLETGPVLVQVARPGYATRLVCADCGQGAHCAVCDGPLRTGTGTGPASCAWCGAIAGAWSCAHCGGHALRRFGAGSVRTADELGRAFPGTRVIVADGDHPHLRVDARPALVVATRGAEPIADGGYRAVLLLDGERMIARESLRVGEDCLRWWSDAAALAAPGAPVVLVGVEGPLATALAAWRQPDFAASELADRFRLSFPPAVRIASVTGRTADVATAVERVRGEVRDVLGPVETDDGARAIVRFDYREGAAVAADLRGELVRLATGRRPAGARAAGPRRSAPTARLRVRLDDPDPFT